MIDEGIPQDRRSPVPPSGPVVDSVRRRSSVVVISFRDVTGALTMRSNSPSGFELCGDTPASCRWADARVQGQSVLLSNAAGATRVRYAWGGLAGVPPGRRLAIACGAVRDGNSLSLPMADEMGGP